MELKNKKAIITGGSKGIGQAIARKFIQEGANVIVFDIEKPKYKAKFYQVDIKSEEEIRKAFRDIKRLDILVNNAGVYFQSSIEKTTKGRLDFLVDTNLKGTFLMCKYALPLLKKSKGQIINISSGLGAVPEPESPAYCATKSALIMLTKCMAQEYAPKGLRVNAILPGPIDTPLLRKELPIKKEFRAYTKLNPMRRVGKPEDVANVALFLASSKANYVTGGLYSVDGGESTSSLYSK